MQGYLSKVKWDNLLFCFKKILPELEETWSKADDPALPSATSSSLS